MKKRVLSLFLAITLCLTLTPTGALAAEGQPPEQTVTATQEAQTGAGENAPPANPEENPTENAPAAAEKNTADEETGKEAVQNEPTMEGKNEPPALNDAGQNATGGGIYVAPGSPTEGGGGTYIPGEDTRTEIWCVSKPDSIGRSYDGTTDGGTIPIDLTFTDGTNEIELKEGTGFTAKKTFDSADAGWHTVTVEIALIGEAAVKYKLKAGEETFTIGGNINKAYPKLTVSLSKTACTAGEKILPLLSVSGVQENAAVTYYYAPINSGYLEFEGSEAVPAIDENTAISEPGTYYVYAKTGETKNYEEERSTTAELTVNEAVVEAASVTKADGADGGTYESLPAALNAAQNGDTVTLLSDVDLGETYVTINKSITFDLGGKTLSSSEAWLRYGVLLVKDATVTVKNGTVKAAGSGSCAIQAYRSGAIMTLEDVTATVTSGKSSVTVGDFGSAVIKSGDYQGLYVGKNSHVTLEGGTFRPYMDNITNKNVKSIFWKVNETTDDTSRDCMELLGDGCVYVDENRTQVRTGGGFNAVVTVQQGTAIDAPVAKIGDVEYASLSKAIDAVQNGGTITLLDDLDLGNGAVLQVGFSQKNFTIDLDNHTLSADGACLIMLHNGSQLTLKNGTLDGSRCTSYEGVLYISSNSGPKLTLENVTAKSGSVADSLNVQRSVPLVYVTNGTVVFDGGTYTGGVLLETDGSAVLKSGTFQKGTNDYSIKTKDSGKHLSDYLDESLFWNGDTVLDLSSETQTADEVTVRPCKHNWENGKCTVCQKVCNHGSADGKSMTEDPCHTCGMKAAAQVDITGSATKYFPSFTDALAYANQNSGCTLKLLADVTETTVMISNPFIFDLNGHNVEALSVDAKATIKDSGTTKGRIGKVTVSNNKVTDLTLGDLLEEGYAFKYENGYWADDSHKETISGLKVTVEEAPIKSVVLDAIGADKKEVPTTMAYGTTGAVTLEASCWINDMTVPTYTWYKLEGAAATAPMEGVNGVKYKLPADLPAGKHTYLVTCTSGGYSKSAEITITVTPISLEGATVTVKDLTYNGQKQFPTVTVKLGETTLTQNTDFYVDATMQANAGSYTLTVNGNGNYSGEIKDVEWKIEPMKIDSVMASSVISKVYDGTAEINMSANEWATALKFKTLSASGVVDVPSEAYTISDAYFVEKSGEETIYSPDAGEKYGITFKITLNDDNYVLQTYGEDTPSTSKVITQSGGATFTIKQATVTSPGEITQLVFNDLAKTYTIDLAKLLPKLSEGCAYGSIQYQGHNYNFTDNAYLDGNDAVSVSKEGVLTLSTVAASTAKVGDQIGTITVPVVTTNYQKFEFTIKVYISERISPNASGVTVSASDITYGQMLNESKLTATGTMKHPGTGEEVKGTFAWTNPEAKPGAAGDYTASWTFTPAAGYEEYATVTGTVTIKVNKATPTFTAPTAQENLTYTGQEQALIIAGSVTSGGTMQYSLTENGTYSQDIPTGTDAGAYTVWYRVFGDANHNDTEPASVPVRIGQKPLTITGVTAASKSYDGTKDAGITSVTFDGVNLNRGTDYTVTANFDDAGAGNDKHITATVTLIGPAAKNYALEQSSFPATGSITKAAAPDFTKETALAIINDYEKTYTVTLPALPKLETPKEYGAPTYELGEIKLNDGYYTSGAKVENGELTLPIQKNDVETTGSVGTVTVVIKSTNYEDITLTVKVNAANKIEPTPDGKITASEITYGDTLSKSKISGKMKDPDTGIEVKGTFAWPYPDDKPKRTGDYNISWIFTPDESYGGIYAAVTDPVKVHVAPKSIEGATITLKKYEFAYNAAEQSPKITRVTLDNWDETGITYIIKSGGSATNANDSITLTIEGIGNYTGTATAKWKIIPAELTVSVQSVEKAYDGTPNATVTPTFNGLQGGETLTAADYSVTAAFEDANVGYKKTVTGTVTLNQTNTAKNYLLNDGNFSTDNGTIAKAAAPTVQPVELTIYNGVQKDYFVDLPPLPALGEGKSYGTVDYNNPHTINLSEGYIAQSMVVADPENLKTYRLLLRMNQTGSLTEEIGTVTIPVTTSNYQDITLTVKVNAVNQITPVPDDGTITATPITYGNELSASTITGTMQDPNTGYAVNGTFTWVTPAEKLKAGSHNAKWIFTPDESNGGKYTTNTGTATVTVNPKAVTVSGITANDKVYDGNTNAVLDYSKVVLDGVLDNDTLTVTATGKLESADVGEKKVTISDLKLGGDSAANYVLAESGNQTETTATITAKEVTVTITSNGGTYGSVVAAAANLSGAVDGENVPVTLTYTGNGYNDTAVPVNAGSYTVTVSIANSNYTLTGNTTADFVITPKAVTVSGITANDKVYDGTTNAVLDYSNAQFDGILENDKLTVAAKGVFEKAEAGKQNVAISDLTLGGDSAANYVLAESGNQTETIATITAKEVTVTPDNKSKVYEEKDPKLTYIVSGVLSGETLKGITLTRAEGENAGEYAITATADAGANPNYDVTFAKGTFTIKPKSIKGATVVLGKGLTANGAEQTQTVEKVLLDDKEIPADSYTVAGNTATDPGSHTLTITAKGNYTGTVEQTYVIIPAKTEDAPDKEIAIGRGKVKVVVKSEGTVPPATLLTNKAELLAMLVDSGDISADELAQIADGASVDIALTVKEANVSAEIKTAMAQAAKGCTIGQYLDISLFKYMTVNGKQQDGVALHTTKNALTISVVVPDALINTNSAVYRTYCIVRNHEGTITVLDAAFDAADKTLTFKTDRFSIYAIAYKDTAVPSSGSNPGSNNSSNDSETKKNEVAAPTPAPTPASTSKPSTITAMPQTGDTSNPTLYVVLLVASLLGLAVVFVCKKRNDK